MASSKGDVIEWNPGASSRSSKRQLREQDPSPRPVRNQDPTEEEIRAALEREAGNVARAAKALGLTSRYALYRAMAKRGVSR
jgi:transcriptional regulator of acetoin/glycerol metabolism